MSKRFQQTLHKGKCINYQQAFEKALSVRKHKLKSQWSGSLPQTLFLPQSTLVWNPSPPPTTHALVKIISVSEGLVSQWPYFSFQQNSKLFTTSNLKHFFFLLALLFMISTQTSLKREITEPTAYLTLLLMYLLDSPHWNGPRQKSWFSLPYPIFLSLLISQLSTQLLKQKRIILDCFFFKNIITHTHFISKFYRFSLQKQAADWFSQFSLKASQFYPQLFLPGLLKYLPVFLPSLLLLNSPLSKQLLGVIIKIWITSCHSFP